GGSLTELMADQLGITGPFQAEAVVKGDTDIPLVDGSLTSSDVRLGNSSLGTARLGAHLVGKELKGSGSPFADAGGDVRLHTRAPYPFVGTLKLDVDDLKPWLPLEAVKQGLGGSFSGTLNGSGDLDSVDALAWRAELEHVTLSRGDFVVSSQ